MRVIVLVLVATACWSQSGRSASGVDSNEVAALMRIGQEHLDRGDLVTAEEAYKRLSTMDGYAEVAGVGGLVAIRTMMGRVEDGLALYREHAQSSGNLEFNAMAAFLLAQQGRNEDARTELAPVVKSLREGGALNATTLSLIAFTDRRVGDLEPGLEAARLAAELFRGEGNPRCTVMGRVAAGLLEDLGRDLEASMEYEAQLAQFPDDAGTLSDFAAFLGVRGKQLDRALQYAQRAIELKPGAAGMLDTLGLVQFKSGKVGEATATLVRAWRREPGATGVRAHLAQALAKGTDHSESMAALLDALRTEPNRANTLEIERLLAAVGR